MRPALLTAGAACAFVAGAIAFQPAQPHFIDITARSKFSYITNNDLSPRKYFVQPMAGGVAIFDYDNDGRMDIFFTNGAKLPELKKTGPAFYNCLLRNKGDGTFEDVTRKAGLLGENLGYNLGVAVGDYDNDGYEDIFICGAGRNTLYHNNGDGTFTDVTEQSGIGRKPPGVLSVGAAWFDYDNDGLLDLVVANYTTWTPQTDRRCSVNGVEYYCSPTFYPRAAHRLYHNLGHGRFEDVTEKSGFAAAPGKGMGISIADFNDDGYQDVFIANDTEPNSLFINKGNGTFEDQGLQLGVAYNDDAKAVSSMGSDAKDYDNDGRVDIFTNNLMGQIWQLFRNRGDFFRYVPDQVHLQQLSQPLSGWSTAFIDYDNDGWKDLYSANGDIDNVKPNSRQHDTMFRNLGGKQFVDVSDQMGAGFLRVGLPARIGDRRSQQRWLRGSGGDLTHGAAPHPPQLWAQRQSLADVGVGGPLQQPRRHWRESEAHHRFRPRTLQSRIRQHGVHVFERQAGALRAGRRKGRSPRSRSDGREARCRPSRTLPPISS